VGIVGATPEDSTEVWTQAAAKIGGLAGDHARHFSRAAIRAPNHLVVSFPQEYTFSRSICDAPDQKAKFERALAEVTGQPLRLEFEVLDGPSGQDSPMPAAPARTILQRRAEAAQHPMVRRAMELFGAFPERVEESHSSES
jgi:hypothetical protein